VREGRLPNGVWATPGLPLLVFVTVGLIVGLIYGDIVWVIIRSALGYS
jgi:prepilin signal peptidase PulO-like enzyme (type II secretory pathway)